MTRIILLLSLVALTFACGNTRPDPELTDQAVTATDSTPAPGQATDKAAETPAAPALEEQAAPQPKVSETSATTRSKKQSPQTTPAASSAATAEEVLAVPAASDQIAATSGEQPSAETTPAMPLTPATPATPATQVEPSPQALPSDKRPRATRPKHFLPTRQRIDREINKLKFAYKGEVMVGLTASYGTLSSGDTEFLTILNNITADATVATVKPFFGYFYRDNHAVGVRFGYSHTSGELNSASFDLGPSNDIGGDIPYIRLKSNNYAFGIFHRSYAGLDPRGRFGLFAEFELSMSTGSSEFTYEQNNKPKQSFSDNTQLKLSFNPGAAVYIFPNVCATLSFGLGGVQYTSVKQKDETGKQIGSRRASNMKFKLNIAAINIGMNVHLWDKKKK